ncbi:MAG: YigZ family protein [Raineya sp.]
MKDTFYSIKAPTESIYKEKGSKFLAFAYPVETEETIKEHLEQLKKKYYDATHHCFAYMLGANGEKWRANDDGEPSHSAGTPILNQIKSKGISDVLVVVVRYYGGTKLGVSGLIQAYKTAAALALQEAEMQEKQIRHFFKIIYNYAETSQVMNLISYWNLNIVSQSFDLFCHLELSCKLSQWEQVSEDLAKWIKNA